MDFTITNGALTARVDARGAELRSLVYDGAEYIWPGGEEWAWSAPVCCPYCGMVEGGEFTHGGVSYAAPRHGFVRESEHALVSLGDGRATFALSVREGDARWPWPFELTADYSLDESSLSLTCGVLNAGHEVMPVQLGFHPGFIAPEGSVIRAEKADMPDGGDALRIASGVFGGGSLDIAAPRSAWFRLERPDGRSVTVETDGWPYVLLWGAPGGTPFACIEPWTGYPGPGSMFDRPGVTALAPGEKFARTLKITVK